MTEDRIRILLTADAVGGVWQYSLDLARGLSALGMEPIIALLGPSPSESQVKAAAGLKLIDTRLPLDWTAPDRAAVRRAGEEIAKLARAKRVDLAQLNSPALAAEAEFDNPVVAVAHSCIGTWWAAVIGADVDEPYQWRSDVAGEGLRRADRVVAPTAAFAEATARVHRLPALPTAIHNGRAPLPLPRVPRSDFAFTAGRLWDQGKNVETLDRAAARLSVPFYAAGPQHGPNDDSIELRHARGLGSLGEPELARWLAARPVFASAALYEPFGLAVLEAAQAGCPLVLSDIPTFRELWDGAAAFVDPMDADGFAAQVTILLDDPARFEAMGAAARQRARRYTPEAAARAMAGIYRDILRKAEVPSAAEAMVAA